MPVVTYDVSGSDGAAAVRDFEPPKPGVYTALVKECKPGHKKGEDGKPDKSRPRIEVVYSILGPTNKGAPLYEYYTFDEGSAWKMDQFLQAIGVAEPNSKRKGQFKTELIEGKKKVRLRVKAGTNQAGDYRGEVGGVFRLSGEDLEGAEDDPFAGLAQNGSGEEDLDELGVAADAEDGDAQARLEEIAGEHELDPNDYTLWADLVVAIQEAQAGLEAEGPGATEPEPGEEEDLDTLGASVDAEDDEAEASQARLEELAAEAGLDPDAYDTWAELATALQEGGGASDDGYDEMSIPDLKTECQSRELATGGSKAALIARLRANDAEEPF